MAYKTMQAFLRSHIISYTDFQSLIHVTIETENDSTPSNLRLKHCIQT